MVPINRRDAMKSAAVVTLAAGFAWVAPTAANAAPAKPATTPLVPDSTIIQARKQDAAGFAARYKSLSSNSPFVMLLTEMVGTAEARRQLQGLAAVTDNETVAAFNRNTAGKVFRPAVISGEWSLDVADEAAISYPAPMAATQMPACWQAWVAAYAWYVGAGTICGAVSLATFMVAMIGGAVCWAGLFTAGMVINWNNACR